METILGIDLGTTKSVVGFWKDGRPFIVPDKFGNLIIPSLVLVTPEKNIFVGREAKNHPDRYSGKNTTIGSIKRLMGKNGETGWSNLKTYPQEVSAYILAELKHQAETLLGYEVNKAVIAIPAHFGESQRRATIEAAEIAGLKVVRLLDEATAAVLAYLLDKDQNAEGNVMVINFGGGTSDVSIVNYGKGVSQVLAIEGDSKLGGDDFDQIIVEYILDDAKKKYGIIAELDSVQRALLKEVAEKAKIELSNAQTTSVYLPGFFKTSGGYRDLAVKITRQVLENGAQNFLKRAENLILKALEEASLIPSNLNGQVLLLGGTSRIPIIRRLVTSVLGVEPFTGVDPETCVAQGATIMAGVIHGEIQDLLLLPVISGSYGIELREGTFQKIMTKNTTIPTKRSEVFTTQEDFQTVISIRIYQGESSMTSDNAFLGTLELRDIPPAPARTSQIEVTFDVDMNMIVVATAKDRATGKEQKVTIKSPYSLSNVQIRVMQKAMKKHLLESQSRQILSSIESLISTQSVALDWSDISNLKDSVKLLRKLASNECSNDEWQIAVSNALRLYDRALQKIVWHETTRKRFFQICGKIDKIVKLLNSHDPKTALILIQGKALLENYQNQNLSIDELQKLYSSVAFCYEKAKADLVEPELEKLSKSQPLIQWINGLEPCLRYTAITNDARVRIKDIGEMESIEVLLRSELFSGQDESSLVLLDQFPTNSFQRALLMLAFVTSTTCDVISAIREICDDKYVELTLAFCLFSSIDSTKNVARRMAAQKISKYLPEVRYIESVVNRIVVEEDIVVKGNLIEYIDRQPPGSFQDYFLRSDPGTKAFISKNTELRQRLLREINEDKYPLILDSLTYFDIAEVLTIILPFCINSNTVIRKKALTIASNAKNDQRVLVLFSKALLDTSPEIQAMALNYLKNVENLDTQLIPSLFTFALDNRDEISNSAFCILEKKGFLINNDFVHFLSIIKKVKKTRHELGVFDSRFLKKFAKIHPEMKKALDELSKKKLE